MTLLSHPQLFAFFGVCLAAAFPLTACQADAEDGSTSTNTGGTANTGGSGTGGGSGGAGATGNTGGVGNSGTGATATGGMGTGGTGPASDHLLFSEVGTAPEAGEFIEIYNPGAIAIDLTDYYISDNSTYTSVTAGTWAPLTNNPGTDFLARFPSGALIQPGAVILIAASDSFNDSCPDYVLKTAGTACGAQAMLEPVAGGLAGTAPSLLSNGREMLILFTWDGNTTTVEDVDYITWGLAYETGTRVNKTGQPGYASDTAEDNQLPAPAPDAVFTSVERCLLNEPGENTSGGNGLGGHDETSENLGASFVFSMAPSAGLVNSCL